ncbi:hypothetical protein SADO_16303 [Salinisphaera dokdonensis CL-ES53]|jgi:hypothetical protein|uniref:Uncharacterized protein n=1 Tax=Salinisphaera dokdonensis CL-ES53 TaxID=1304272 RepID=A0ABV2B5F1_9GAMM
MIDQDTFVKDLVGEDELGVVIRAHIHIEAWLNEVLSQLVVDMEYLEKAQLEYHQRVNLAIALGLKEQHRSPLLAFGKLRNAFAHNVGQKLTKDRVDNLYKSLSPEDKVIAHRVYESTRSELDTGGEYRSLRELDPKDQFVLWATALHGMLRAAVKQLRGDV